MAATLCSFSEPATLSSQPLGPHPPRCTPSHFSPPVTWHLYCLILEKQLPPHKSTFRGKVLVSGKYMEDDTQELSTIHSSPLSSEIVEWSLIHIVTYWISVSTALKKMGQSVMCALYPRWLEHQIIDEGIKFFFDSFFKTGINWLNEPWLALTV